MYMPWTAGALAVALTLGVAAAGVDPADPLDGKTFRSVEKLEAGRGGAKMHWQLSFQRGKFRWRYSDVSESGTYTFDARTNAVLGATGGRDQKIKGQLDRATGVLVWDGVRYQAPK
jgi:hypothetical protein